MLDKVLYVNKNHVVIYYTTHMITVTSDCGDAMDIVDRLLAPFASRCETYSEFLYVLGRSKEDTLIIDMEEVA